MDELARLLGHERLLLELLLFKLIEERHLLVAGEARFLSFAAAEVEQAVERLQEAELRRSVLVHRLAGELDLPEEALTMSALARNSLEPYKTIFSDDRKAFLELAAEIEDLASLVNATYLHPSMFGGLESTAAADMDLQLAEIGYQAVLGATARLSMPSLADWLK